MRRIILSLLLMAGGVSADVVLEINASNQYQQIDGFGAALTDSSAWLMQNSMSGEQRTNLLLELFSEEQGIGLSVIRHPIGASDFRLADYTFDDMPAGQLDYNLTNFSIAHDEAYIIPLLQEIGQINTNLYVIGTPWSPPAWMKDSTNLYYGSLRDDVYDTYANYFLRYVQGFESNGVSIRAITLQNEPLYEPYHYPGMYMTPSNQAQLARLVGGLFVTNSVDTRILVYDHNWDQFTYPINVYDDEDAFDYIAGSAFHGYAGDVAVQSLIHDAQPDKEIHFTEICSGEWGSGFDETLLWDVKTLLVGSLRNWSRTMVKWNVALDENNGPKTSGGCDTCYGVVTINSSDGSVTRNADYYSLAHAAKFVRPGAQRIAVSEESADDYTGVAFRNPDGSLALITFNEHTTPQNYVLRWNGQSCSYMLPARSVVTFCWSNTTEAAVDVWLTTGDEAHLLELQPEPLVFCPSMLEWKGWTWDVRDVAGNPGNNDWAARNVWLDTNDYLHLSVSEKDGNWSCGEVCSQTSPGPGTYRWYVIGEPSQWDSNTVAGLGTYYDASHELDVYLSRAMQDEPTNLHYTVQPYYEPGHQFFTDHSFTSQYTTHEMVWNPRRVTFRSWYGHTEQPEAGSMISEWTYEGDDIPGDTNEIIRMNLWMFDAQSPPASQHVVLADFQYQSSTGMLMADDFEDDVLSNIWAAVPPALVSEANGDLVLDPDDTDNGSVVCRAATLITREEDGRTLRFCAALHTATVETASSAGPVDLWGYQALMEGSNGTFDAWSASNAIILRSGYRQASDTLVIELLSKQQAPNSWGALLFNGVVSNASSFMDGGLNLAFSLVLSNYAVEVTYAGNPILFYTQSGSVTGLHGLGTAVMEGVPALGACNQADGRGTWAWESMEIRADAELGSDDDDGSEEGPGEKVIQIGLADPAMAWSAPIDTRYPKHRILNLYEAEMIDRPGTITQLLIYVLSPPDLTMQNYCIRMQHSSLAGLSESFINDGWTTVYQGAELIPTEHRGWYAFSFSTPFVYDGTNNLLIDYCFNNTSSDSDPLPTATYTPSEYASCFTASASKDDPLTWSGYPKGRKSKFAGGRLVDIRLAFSNEPMPQICTNLSFEYAARGFITNVSGWQVEGSVYGGSIKSAPVLHGTNALKLWKGTGTGDQKIFQFFDVSGTNAYQLSGSILALSTEPFSGSNAYGALCLEWYGAGGLLASDESAPFTEASSHDVWAVHSVSSCPPANCTSGRIVCALFSSDDQEGSLFFDKLSLTTAESDGSVSPPVGTNVSPAVRQVLLYDEFNDTVISNIWGSSGWWDGTDIQENGETLKVQPGSNVWHTAGYVSAETLNWNDTNIWYVFSAVLSTIRVDAAGSGEDADMLLALCGLPDNPWWVTNSCSLYGHYDQEVDTLRLRFLTKIDTPANNGTDRYGATIQSVSTYMTATNQLHFYLAFGYSNYQVRVLDSAAKPVPLISEWGNPYDQHNLADRLYNAYWFVGAQNDNTNRGAVFWDRTEVFTISAPTAAVYAAGQVSTDGSGHVAVTCRVADVDGDDCLLRLMISTNGGTLWLSPWLDNATSHYGTAVADGLRDVQRAATTNAAGLLVENEICVDWETQNGSDELGLSTAWCTNLLVRLEVFDTAVAGVTVTGTIPYVDNVAPVAGVVTVASGQEYVWTNELSMEWSGFTDVGVGVAGYYYGVSNAVGSVSGHWTTALSGACSNLSWDQVVTALVCAVDSHGNIGSLATDEFVVLSAAGDWDNDALVNSNEEANGCSPVLSDSDSDEMPDGWEVFYGYNPGSSGDGADDEDGDGYSNRDEYLAGTEPDNSSSLQQFVSDLSTHTGVLLQWNTVTGRTYHVLTRNEWTSEWSTVTTVPGDGAWLSYTGQTGEADGFYRIRVTLP